MIWALAGLGDEPAPFSTYNSGYTPTVAPVTPIVGTVPPGVLRMDSPPASQSSALAGVDSKMVIGVLAAVAVLGLMAYRGEMSPNAKGRRKGNSRPSRRWSKRWRSGPSTEATLFLHHSGSKDPKKSLASAKSFLKRHGLRGKMSRRGRGGWIISVKSTLGRLDKVYFSKEKPSAFEMFVD